jgi:hypothetical protein
MEVVNKVATTPNAITRFFVPLQQTPKITAVVIEWHDWITLIVFRSLPFDAIEDPDYREFKGSKELFSRRQLERILDGLVMKVQEALKTKLPSKFGLLLDSLGAQNGTHITAVFATWLEADTKKKFLLFVIPSLDEIDYSAESYHEIIVDKLRSYYNIDLNIQNPIQDMTAADVSTNYNLAKLLQTPMITSDRSVKRLSPKVLHYLRKNPADIELVLCLGTNKELWNEYTVAEVVGEITFEVEVPDKPVDFYTKHYEVLSYE